MEKDRSLATDRGTNLGKSVPCALSLPIGTWKKHKKTLLDLVLEYTDIIDTGFGPEDKPWEQEVRGYHLGETYTDPWGCVLKNVHEGVDGLIVGHPLADWSKLDSYQMPDTIKYTDSGEQRDWKQIEKDFARGRKAGDPLGWTLIRCLYQRLHMQRGYENFFMDIGEDHPKLHRLADMITDANMRMIDKMLGLGATFFTFSDHIGMQDRFPLSPQAWNRVFQPRYERMFQRVRQAGGRVSFYSDGHMVPVWEKLIRAGVTDFRVQANTNRIEDMVRLLKGRTMITYDMDRQYLLRKGSAEEIEKDICRAVKTLGSPDGGLGICARIELDVPLENVRAVLEAMRKYCGRNLPDGQDGCLPVR